MRLTVVNGVFVAECTFAEKDTVKAAGFWWHGGGCRSTCKACAAGLGKVWWTPFKEKAAHLIKYATEEAAASLKATVEAVEGSRATDAVLDIPCPEGLAYMPFQRAGIAYAMGRTSTLIADEMGLGKTIQAIGVINTDGTARSVLVVCPASLRINWARESVKWLVAKRPIYVVGDMKDPEDGAYRVVRDKSVPADADLVYIVNYDRMRDPELKTKIMSRVWDVLVVDEAHALKTPTAQRTKALIGVPERKKAGKVIVEAEAGIVSQTKRRMFLTGTPILNRPKELWTLLSAIEPTEFRNFFAFAMRYCGAYQEVISPGTSWEKKVWNFDGASNLPELQQRLRATCMVRRLKADVLKELPSKRRQVVLLPTNGSKRVVDAENKAWDGREERLEALREAADFAHATGDEAAYRKAVRSLTDEVEAAFTEMSAHRHATAVAKVDASLEYIDNALEGTDKVIVFAHHKDVVEKIVEHYGDAAVVLVGDTKPDDRQKAVDRFQTDPKVRVFVGSIGAAGVGITLTAASTVIFVELSWVPGEVSQAEDRAHRIGQTDAVNVVHLVLEGSLDARMAHTLVAKQEVAEAALDNLPVIPEPKAAADAPRRAVRPPKYPVATPEQKAMARSAMRYLASVCDGAQSEDFHGFNRFDTQRGHALAMITRDYSDGETWYAALLARKYRKQVLRVMPDALTVLDPVLNTTKKEEART